MSLRRQVNDSGYPLQLAVAEAIRSVNSGWNVLYEEHQWAHAQGNGFIDLVLEDSTKTWLMNVECKRVRDSSWVFLRDQRAASSHREAKVWVSRKIENGDLKFFDWLDVPIDPDSAQSCYCIVRGQDARSRPMLERTAASVVLSTEALAREEAALLSDRYSHLRIYQNVVVTTATLVVCNIDVNAIDVASGEIGNDAEFDQVPFVRFRKQLGASAPSAATATLDRDVRAAIREKESTVFVVNSNHFADFVATCELPDDLGKYIYTR